MRKLVVFKVNRARMDDALFLKDIHAVTIPIVVILRSAKGESKKKKR